MTRLKIIKSGINGEGIGFFKRKPVFVDGCYKNEVVECKLIDEGNHYRGKLIKILEYSKERVKPKCPLQKICGGCNLMAVNYDEQLRIKKELLEGALDKYFTHFEGLYILNTFGNSIMLFIYELSDYFCIISH